MLSIAPSPCRTTVVASSAWARGRACHKDPAVCQDCHGLPMPHPADFRPQHAKVATSRADVRCRKCHTEYDCRNCHARHAHPKTTDGTIPSSRLPLSRSVPQ